MSILKKISVFTMFLVLSVLFLAPVNAEAATVGQQLTSPEDGWTRYDDSDSHIVYTGSGWKQSVKTQQYNGALTFSTSKDDVIKFKFQGTKVRIIYNTNTSTFRGTINVSVDGVEESFSDVSSTWIPQVLVYEKTGLTEGIHTVKITNPTNGKEFGLDAVDLLDSDYLVDYYQPTNLTATTGDTQVTLTWDAIDDATSYNIKRSLTSGGPYETIATSSAVTFTDTDVTAGTAYYYVVSAVTSDLESSDSNEASATPTASTTVTAKLKVVLEVGEELQLSVDDDLDVNTEMTWTSSDNAVATVDLNGVITALTAGNTVITVTSVDGTYTDYINVLVVEDATDYRLAIDLKVGQSCRLTVDDLTDTVNVTWDTSDESVAAITDKGKVTAVSAGLTLITATDEEGNIIGQVYVRVRE